MNITESSFPGNHETIKSNTTTLIANSNNKDRIKKPSFPSTLQLRVSFGLLNNLPPFFSIPRLTVWFLNNLVFMV
jgi:hypothetical protein